MPRVQVYLLRDSVPSMTMFPQTSNIPYFVSFGVILLCVCVFEHVAHMRVYAYRMYVEATGQPLHPSSFFKNCVYSFTYCWGGVLMP